MELLGVVRPFDLGVAFVAATIPFVIAIAVALRRASRPKNVADFFLYQQSLSVRDFQTSSVGYGLQVAAIFLFFYWGSTYGGWALFVPLFWYLGYLLMSRFVAKGWADKLLLSNRPVPPGTGRDQDAGTALSLAVRSGDPSRSDSVPPVDSRRSCDHRARRNCHYGT